MSTRQMASRSACLVSLCVGFLCVSATLATQGDPVFTSLPYLVGLETSGSDQEAVSARLAVVVERMTTLAAESGQKLLPTGATFDSLAFDKDNMARVALTVPAESGFDVSSEMWAESLTQVLRGALAGPLPELGGLRVDLRIGSGPYKGLTEYTVQPPPLPAESDVSDDTGKTAEQIRSERAIANKQLTTGSVELAGAVANADGQPVGALSGVVVFCAAGHGWTAGTSSWSTQRGLLYSMVEDYGNIDQLNFFVNYCYNAGAVVVPFRPVGNQPLEIVLDNDDPGVTFTGSWTNSTTAAEYYENNVTTSGVRYRYTTSSQTETATARYTPTITQSDFYPVYCWTRDNTDRVLQTYRIHHSGGTAVVKIDHTRVGKGWMWLGTFYFEAGTGGYVEISNQSTTTPASTVVADAIRFGCGIGDVVGEGPGAVSGYPRDEEAQRYWAQSEAGIHAVGLPTSIWNRSTDDSSENVGTAARWAAVMNRQDINDDRWRRIYLEFHSNATDGVARGTVALVTSPCPNYCPTANQVSYATVIGEKVEADMVAQNSLWEYPWTTRGNVYASSYGAINTANNGDEFDATILEVAFHDNLQDAAIMRNARARDAVAKSSMQSIVKFLNSLPGSGVPLVYLPDPPETVRATHDGSGNIVLSWTAGPARPTYPASGDVPTGYKVYRSTNGYGFGNAVDAGNVLSTTIGDVPANTVTYFRVAAYNAGGESMPSRTVAVRRAASGASPVLIVDGYDRVSRQQNDVQVIPLGSMERVIARKTNSFDYAVQHATALAAAGVAFDGVDHNAVIDGTVALGNYRAVVWILGRESSADKTFDSVEQGLISTYLSAGGRLFASGSEIAYELDSLDVARSFYRDTLRAAYVADSSGTYEVSGAGGVLSDIGTFNFSPASGAAYDAKTPDVITPQSGAVTIASYTSTGTPAAGIQYDSGTYRLIMFGFPFETISSESVRAAIMQRSMNYLLETPGCPDAPDRIANFEGYAEGTSVMFENPRYSGSTISHLASTPNAAAVTAIVPGYDGAKSCMVQWAWLDAQPTRWLRLTTNQTANLPNPAIDLRRAVRLRLRLDSGSFRLALGVRETGTDVAVGENGGTSGTIEWIGADSVVAGGGPYGALVTAQPGVWQTITFRPVPGMVQPMTGDGYLSAANNKGVLEHLAFTAVDTAGPLTVYIDSIEQPCLAAADFDQDGDVDLDDFGHLQMCLTGTAVPQNSAECQDAKLAGNSYVDGSDLALFAACLSGANVPAEPACAE